ncbi:hypothetical protein ACFL45_07735 [Candidatus Neomarinimicrobiota bacterium]
MLTTLWHRIIRNQRRNGQLEKVPVDPGSASISDRIAPVNNPGPEPDRESETANAGMHESGQKEDGPFRMHQVPWIAIR